MNYILLKHCNILRKNIKKHNTTNMSAMRMKLEPKQKQTQNLSLKLVKVGAVSLVVFGIVSTVVFFYSNLGVNDDAAAQNKVSSLNAGSALKFSEQSDVVSFGNFKSKFPDKFTVMEWVKWDVDPGTGNNWANTFSYTTEKSDVGVFWMQHDSDNNVFEFAVETEKGRVFAQSDIRIQKDVWYHLAGVYDGSNIKLYINGVLESQTSHRGRIDKKIAKESLLTLGGWASSANNNRKFTGVIDEASLWDYALTADEIQVYMASKITDKNKNISLYFPMDEGTGTSITNYFDKRYKGEISNVDWVVSGAPVSNESIYLKKGIDGIYSYTYSNGYSVFISNLSSKPEAVLFYYDQINDSNDPATTFSDFVFNTGYMGFYIIEKGSTISYSATFSKNSSQVQTLSNARTLGNQNHIVLSRPSAENSIWSEITADGSETAFQFNSSTSRIETAVGVLGSVLPIELGYFRGRLTAEGSVLLEWATYAEINNEYFTIERSLDGKEYDIIDELDGAGNSTETITYEYYDEKPLSGISYYRLKQTDYDGKFEYSDPITIKNEQELASLELESIYPNPFTDRFKVKYYTGAENPVRISLVDMNGTEVYTELVETYPGNNSYEYTGVLNKGIYVLALSQIGQETQKMRIIRK